MKPYDPEIQYFGPQGHWLSEFIKPYPPGIPQLRSVFNKAGYNHDFGYMGDRMSGFLGWLKDAWRRLGVDEDFLNEMEEGIYAALDEGIIEPWQADIALSYAKAAYIAVRGAGWKFYKNGGVK